jgi:multicomponent Na+:H+ antiporter subunit E
MSSTADPAGARSVRALGSLVLRTAIAAAAWWAFVEGDLQGPWLATGAVAAAVASSYAVIAPGTVGLPPPVGLVRFAAFFLVQSLLGGIDVLMRALHPSRVVEPCFVEVTLRLPDGAPRLVLAGVASLLPGTLSAELAGERLLLHVLDERIDAVPKVRALEDRIAGAMGLGALAAEGDVTPPRRLADTDTEAT